MKIILSAIALVLTTVLCQAAEFPEPAQEPLNIGDSWTFKRVAKGENVNQSRIIFKIAQQGADNQYIYQSLSGEVSGKTPTTWRNAGKIDMDSCMIDFFGGGQLGLTHSCSTPLVPGMDWNTEETDKGVRTIQRYQVIGQEEVTVGAGTFRATRIESQWEVAKVLNPGKLPLKYAPPLRYQFTYWYVPETKTMAKTEREFRNSAGAVDMRSTDELEAFRVMKKR
jgi:hypothetical protein